LLFMPLIGQENAGNMCAHPRLGCVKCSSYKSPVL
jgi:hypothetical protein